MIYERLLLKHQCAFSKTPFFTEHLQWLLLTVSGFQPTALLKKRLGERCLSVNFEKIFENIFCQNTSGWLLLVFVCELWEVFQITSFIEHLWETAYFIYKFNFNHHTYNKQVFHMYFSSISYKKKKKKK